MAQDLNELRKLLAELNTLRVQFNKNPLGEEGLGRATKSMSAMTRQIEEFKRQLSELDDTWGSISGIIEDIKTEFGKATDGMKTAMSSFNRLQSISHKFQEDALDIQRMTSKEIKSNITNIRKEIKIQQDSLKLLLQKAGIKKDISELTDEEVDALKNLTDNEKKMVKELKSENIQNSLALKYAKDRLKTERDIQKTMGIAGAAIKGMVGSLGKLGIHSDFFEDIEENMYEAAKSGSKLKAAFAGLKGLGKGLFQALGDPVVQFGLLTKAITALYKLTGLVKTQSKQAALATSGVLGRGFFVGIQNARTKTNLLFEEAAQAANTVREELGFVPSGIGESVEAVHKLTNAYGMTGKEATNLLQVSHDLGVPLDQMPETLGEASGSFEAMTGYSVDFQKSMKIIGASSAIVRSSMHGSAQGLVKAANYAALMRMSLDDIRQASESTLDFQSSIQKEMEAELFLQKDLNLENYRYAALTGNTELAAKELQRLIKENGPALKKNTLAQQAFADSIGISREQLAEGLESMELQKELGFESADSQKALNALLEKGLSREEAIAQLRRSGAAGVEKAIEQQMAHENRMKNIMRKFQEAFIPLAEKVFSEKNIAMIENFAHKIASLLQKISPFFEYLPELVAGFATFKLVSTVLKAFNPTMNVGYMNVMGSNIGGGGGYGPGGYGPGGGGPGGGPGGRRSRGPLKKDGTPDMRYKANKTRTRTRRRGGGGRFGRYLNIASYALPALAMTAPSLMGGFGDDEGYAEAPSLDMSGGMAGPTAPTGYQGYEARRPGAVTQVMTEAQRAAVGTHSAGSIDGQATPEAVPDENYVPFREISDEQLAFEDNLFKADLGTTAASMALSSSAGTKVMEKVVGQTATKVASKSLAAAVPVLDVVAGGYFGYQDVQDAEALRATGDNTMREGITSAEGITYGILTGGARTGSILTDVLGGERGSVGDELLGLGTAAASGATTGAGIGGAIGAFFGGVGAAPGAAIGGAIGAVVGTVTEGFKIFTNPDSSLRKGLSEGLDWIGNKISDGWDYATESLGEGIDWLGEKASQAGEWISDTADGIWEGTKDIASTAYDYAASAANTAYDYASSAVDSIGSGLSAAGDWVTSWFANGGIAPGGFQAFASGGIVSKPTLGLVGEGRMNEAIIPLPDGQSVPVRMHGGDNNNEVVSLLKELIGIVKQGGNVYIDGKVAGQTLALANSRMG